MARSRNTELLSHIDCPGGGQVWVDGTTLYVGHMRAPTGTSVYDVSDPKSPRQIARLDLPPGWHSHKVRVADGLMLVNHERQGQAGAHWPGSTSSKVVCISCHWAWSLAQSSLSFGTAMTNPSV